MAVGQRASMRMTAAVRARRGAIARPISPRAGLTGSDLIAVIVYGAAAELDLRVGRDLAVVGFDGSVSAALLHPRLTSVIMPVEDIAGRIVARALRQIEHGYDGAPGEMVVTGLREGGSTRLAAETNRKRFHPRVLTWRDLPGQDDVHGFWRGFSR